MTCDWSLNTPHFSFFHYPRPIYVSSLSLFVCFLLFFSNHLYLPSYVYFFSPLKFHESHGVFSSHPHSLHFFCSLFSLCWDLDEKINLWYPKKLFNIMPLYHNCWCGKLINFFFFALLYEQESTTTQVTSFNARFLVFCIYYLIRLAPWLQIKVKSVGLSNLSLYTA